MERTVAHLFGDAEALPSDLFERLAALSMRKLEFFREQPDAYRLVWAAVTTLPEPFRVGLLEKHKAAPGAHWALPPSLRFRGRRAQRSAAGSSR